MCIHGTFVVVGGGIAGVTCAQTLASYQPNASVILLTESNIVKTATNLVAITRTIVNFSVVETNAQTLIDSYPNLKVIHDKLVEIDNIEKVLITSSSIRIKYGKVCICTGAKPKLLPQAELGPQYVLGIRDTDSVELFLARLKNCEKVAIVGNGGISSELIYKMFNVEVDWIIRDDHISSTFVDPGGAVFLSSQIVNSPQNVDVSTSIQRMRYTETDTHKSGAALGPDWYNNFNIMGRNNDKSVKIHYNCEIVTITIHPDTNTRPVELQLSDRSTLSCDLVISATGVEPNGVFVSKNQLKLDANGAIEVDEYMQSSIDSVYAAGDCCCAKWAWSKHWFQMRLWNQARQMGEYAAKSMIAAYTNQVVLQDFCFEIFTHCTKLFGYKVVLLGLYNGQKLGQNYEILLRTTPHKEYVKFVLENHRLQGAILIGETDLEEMCENLILNQLDLEQFGDDILNPNIEIDDYFD